MERRKLELHDLEDERSPKKKKVNGPSIAMKLNDLPEVCLAVIFLHVPVPERIRLERVCRKWQKISMKSWKYVEKLVITSPKDARLSVVTGVQDYVDLATVNNHILRSVLSRCGEHIEHFSLQEFGVEFDNEILTTVYKNCQNIVTIEIQELRHPYQKGLGKLFAHNSKIEDVTLVGCFNGIDECLQYVPTQSLKELKMCVSMQSTGVYYLKELLKNARSLKNLKIRDYAIDVDTIELIGGIRNLQILCLYDFKEEGRAVQQAFMRIADLTNLEMVSFDDRAMTDEFLIKLVQNSQDIQYLSIADSESITDRGLEAIGALSKLRALDVAGISQMTDGILGELQTYHLERLRCARCIGITDRGIISLIRRSPNLQELYIWDCSIKNYPEMFNAAAGAVEARQDGSVLKFVVHCSIDISNYGDFQPYLVIWKLEDED